ncbi:MULTISPECIES: hypothetical protein [unclassified Roseovarius]|uniref:hypothetical protein n=2 Tax=Roseovarius TaxID=74030 RepID=UPI00273F7685|nr:MULTISPECIES: hypothetical protein [unclassified Roseovarius]
MLENWANAGRNGRTHRGPWSNGETHVACRIFRLDDQEMSGMKTGAFVLGIMLGGPAAATTLPQVFASCTGRFSAELEHAWLMRSVDAEVLELRRAHFEDMLASVTKNEMRSSLLDQRIKAKSAHAHILSMAQFERDPDIARWARHRAKVEIGYCESLLLES